MATVKPSPSKAVKPRKKYTNRSLAVGGRYESICPKCEDKRYTNPSNDRLTKDSPAASVRKAMVCWSCKSKGYGWCSGCQEVVTDSYVASYTRPYCRKCLQTTHAACNNCDAYYKRTEGKTIDRMFFCQRCLDKDGRNCCQCEKFLGCSHRLESQVSLVKKGSTLEYACQNCARGLERCPHCGYHISPSDIGKYHDRYGTQTCGTSLCRSYRKKGSNCEERATEFTVISPKYGEFTNDKPKSVEVMNGITDTGKRLIHAFICNEMARPEMGGWRRESSQNNLADMLPMSPSYAHRWTKFDTEYGCNFPKAVSKRCRYYFGKFLNNAQMETIGNIHSQNTLPASNLKIMFSRLLNRGASYFFHEQSCWWAQHSGSRCLMKKYGGMGMMVGSPSNSQARIWIVPIAGDIRAAAVNSLNCSHCLTEDNVAYDPTVATAWIAFNPYGSGKAELITVASDVLGFNYKTIKILTNDHSRNPYVNNCNGVLLSSDEHLSKVLPKPGADKDNAPRFQLVWGASCDCVAGP